MNHGSVFSTYDQQHLSGTILASERQNLPETLFGSQEGVGGVGVSPQPHDQKGSFRPTQASKQLNISYSSAKIILNKFKIKQRLFFLEEMKASI